MTVDPYDPDAFRRDGHAVIDLLADYLKGTANREGPVLDFVAPAELVEQWAAEFSAEQTEGLVDLTRRVISESLGLGAGGVVGVEADDQLRLDPDAIADAHREAERNGRRVFAIVGSACTTATGAFDPLDAIADYAEVHGLWFHVDGAHGAVAALSSQYRHLAEADGVRTTEEDLGDLLAAIREAAASATGSSC